MVFIASLLGAEHERGSLEKKPISSLVLGLGKALKGMSPSLCGRQIVESSSLPIGVA